MAKNKLKRNSKKVTDKDVYRRLFSREFPSEELRVFRAALESRPGIRQTQISEVHKEAQSMTGLSTLMTWCG